MIRWLKDAALAFIVWAVAFVHDIRERIREARNPKPASRKAPAEGETFDVFVPAAAGPLVESPVSKDPLLLTQLPVRSTKADAKRAAHEYAKKRTGNPNLTWKQANRLMNQWGREEREQERELARSAPEYAERMREIA